MTVSGGRTLDDVEAHIAYNEKTISDLSEMVVSQGREIDRLKIEIEGLRRQIRQIAEGEVDTL
ncbi:MAG: SlyX family protein [Kiloniellaceae bacterium]